MQHIAIQLETEDRSLIKKLDINFAQILKEIEKKYSDFSEKENTRLIWLMSIDPYGDTVFNVLQRPHLINELIYFYEKSSDNNLKANLITLITFIKDSNNDNHSYLRFIGD